VAPGWNPITDLLDAVADFRRGTKRNSDNLKVTNTWQTEEIKKQNAELLRLGKEVERLTGENERLAAENKKLGGGG
jgi:hypothetical protein